MGEKLYHLVIDGEEQGLVLRGLEALKEELMDREDMGNCVKVNNELILKISCAPTKKLK